MEKEGKNKSLAQALKSSAGFTLLEMVTTIGIISLLVAMGVPPFLSFTRHNSIRQSAQDTRNFLLEAQSLAKNPRIEDKGTNGKDYYYVRIDYRDKDNITIELGAGKLQAESGRPMPWDDSLGSKIRRVREEPIKERRQMASEVDVLWIQPERLDPSISTFAFLVPSGKLLIDFYEPYPGLGYSPMCQSGIQNCSYRQEINRNAGICLWLKDPQSYEDYLRQLVTIDGHGGAVEIKEGTCQ